MNAPTKHVTGIAVSRNGLRKAYASRCGGRSGHLDVVGGRAANGDVGEHVITSGAMTVCRGGSFTHDSAARSWASTITEGPGAKDAPHPFTNHERAPGHDVFGLGEREHRAILVWVGENLPQVRRSVYEQRLLYWSLGIGLVVGPGCACRGYLLKSSATTEPFGLVADLLYALGWALWTGVVVVMFVQIVPEANDVNSRERWMPTRRRCASRPEPEATGLRASGRAEQPPR
jgi:hypothetical protein